VSNRAPTRRSEPSPSPETPDQNRTRDKLDTRHPGGVPPAQANVAHQFERLSLTQARIERVAQPVAKQISPPVPGRRSPARERCQPARLAQELPPVVEHIAPRLVVPHSRRPRVGERSSLSGVRRDSTRARFHGESRCERRAQGDMSPSTRGVRTQSMDNHLLTGRRKGGLEGGSAVSPCAQGQERVHSSGVGAGCPRADR
jgi:hypothetical protein